MKKQHFIKCFLLYFLALPIKGQEISFALDSIHNLSKTNFEKLDLYYAILNQHQLKKDYKQLGSDAHQLAKWIHREKHIDESIKIVKMAYEAREKVIPIDKELLKRSYFNYAIYHKRIKSYSIAINFFKKVLNIEASNHFKGRAACLIGNSYQNIGDLHNSIKYHKKAFNLFNSKTKTKFITGNHIDLALAYGYLRNHEGSKQGIYHLLKADSILKLYNKYYSRDSYTVHNNLGSLYFEGVGTKDISKGINSLKLALDVAIRISNSKDISQAYYNLAVAYTEYKPIIASTYFSKALEKAKENKHFSSKIHFGMGINSLKHEKYFQAQNNFTTAFFAFINKDIKDIYWLPGPVDLEMIEDKTRFLELLKRRIFGWNELATLENKEIYSLQAIKTAKVADQLFDILVKENFSYNSKLFWRDICSEIYIMALKACLDLKKFDEAFYFIEKNKALLLTKEIVNKNLNIPKEILELEQKKRNRILEIKNSISNDSLSLIKKIKEAKKELNKFKDSVSSKYPEYFLQNNDLKLISLKEIEPQKNDVIFNYIMAERITGVIPEAYGMVISIEKTSLFKITDVDSLLSNIKIFREKLDQPFTTAEDLLTYKKTANQIYNTLIPKEVQAELKDKKVTILSDHMINFIPFEALVTDVETGKYLIEDCEIHYEYSLSFQKENESISRNATNDFLGMAPVDFSNDLAKLQHSQKEITAANQLYSGDVLINDLATKENFIKYANDSKILHLATHADASDSIAPWIAFRNSQINNQELNDIRNQAELVLLSACNTSIGEVRRGEGVLSLARSFFQGGANTVIPSLWSTNDKATATITSDFYKNLSQGQTKSEALRSAKLNYLNNNTDAEASPHYWASLVLIGDTGTLLPQTNYWSYGMWIGLAIVILILLWFLFIYKKKKATHL